MYHSDFVELLKAQGLMNCEVSLILDRKYEQFQQMSDDPTNQISQVFEKSIQYVKRFSRYKNPDAVRQVREILSRNQLAEFELCVLGNLCPETVEEAIAMVSSLKDFTAGTTGASPQCEDEHQDHILPQVPQTRRSRPAALYCRWRPRSTNPRFVEPERGPNEEQPAAIPIRHRKAAHTLAQVARRRRREPEEEAEGTKTNPYLRGLQEPLQIRRVYKSGDRDGTSDVLCPDERTGP